MPNRPLLRVFVVIAHKTGTLSHIRGDAAIIYCSDGPDKQPFLLSVFVQGTPTPQAEQIITEIALLCYNYFSH